MGAPAVVQAPSAGRMVALIAQQVRRCLGLVTQDVQAARRDYLGPARIWHPIYHVNNVLKFSVHLILEAALLATVLLH